MESIQSPLGFKQKTIAVMVGMALPALMQLSVAEAACTSGTASVDANTVTCTEGSTYTNSATIQNTATISSAGATTSVVEMDGNSNRFNNTGSLTNDSVYSNTGSNMGQKYGVYIGANAGSATTDDTNKLSNSGTISATISSANMSSNAARVNTGAVVGLGTDAEGEYELTNTGTISATHYGVGRVNGVEAGGDVESMTINNSGTIVGTSASVITKVASTATSLTGTTSLFGTAASIGVSAGIYAEEEVQSLTINNENGGLISGVGSYASGIYTRSNTTITNAGTITGETASGTSTIGIAQVSDSYLSRSMDLDNSGTINGDILSVNGSALRWWSLSNGEGTSGATIDARLLINSQNGEANSNISNSGSINGDIYYSNGKHVLNNSGSITGHIDLDQRDTTRSSTVSCTIGDTASGCWTAQEAPTTTGVQSGSDAMSDFIKVNVSSITSTTITFTPTVVGAKAFTFENSGSFDGNLTIHTASSTLADGTAISSNINLIPTITGQGGSSADSASSSGIAGMGNTLNVITSAGGNVSDITIKPKIANGVSVVDAQYYKLANTFQINSSNVASGATSTPTIEASNSLLSWTASVNSSNALVLKSEVNNATAVEGVSGNSANALNTLMNANNPLFSTIANMDSDSKVAQAAQSLVPEVNGASVNAAQKALGSSMQIISNRNSVAQTNFIGGLSGQSGVSTGDEPNNTGVWVQGVGFTAEQDKRKQADGYQVNAYGMALGVDRIINADNNLRVGGAFTYTNSSIDAKGSNTGDSVDLNSYLGSVYASMNMGDWYLNSSLIAGQHKYDSKRVVVGNVARGNYDANQFGINAEAGMPIRTGLGTLIPVVSAAYNYLDIDGYTERGAGGLKISGESVDSFRTGLGARMLFPIYKNNSFFEVRGIWFHEFADNRFDTTGRFTTGGSSFKTAGVTQARDSANFGASLKLMGDAGKLQQSLLLSYDGEVKDQYVGHTGSIQIRFDF